MRAPRAPRPGTVADLLREGSRLLARSRVAFGHGTTSAREEAAFLVAHALGLAPGRLEARLDRAPASRQRAAALALIERRIRERVPAAYLARTAWLADFRFYVDERVIVPRSHIAGLLRDGLAPWLPDPRAVRTALDLCTGSGCLAVIMARTFARARVDASDVSPVALEVARRNIALHRLERRVRLLQSDLFGALSGRRYDLIVSNPPYVQSARLRRLPPEYRREPRIALAGGASGLAHVRRILREARAHLNPGGQLLVEVGAGRRRTEQAFPGIEFTWPETPAGYPVFIVSREQLPKVSGTL